MQVYYSKRFYLHLSGAWSFLLVCLVVFVACCPPWWKSRVERASLSIRAAARNIFGRQSWQMLPFDRDAEIGPPFQEKTWNLHFWGKAEKNQILLIFCETKDGIYFWKLRRICSFFPGERKISGILEKFYSWGKLRISVFGKKNWEKFFLFLEKSGYDLHNLKELVWVCILETAEKTMYSWETPRKIFSLEDLHFKKNGYGIDCWRNRNGGQSSSLTILSPFLPVVPSCVADMDISVTALEFPPPWFTGTTLPDYILLMQRREKQVRNTGLNFVLFRTSRFFLIGAQWVE